MITIVHVSQKKLQKKKSLNICHILNLKVENLHLTC